MIFALIVFTAVLNTAAQILLKAGMQRIGEFAFTSSNFLPIVTKIALSPFVLFGLIIYVISVSLWLLVLSRVPVAIAYPLTSLGYIFNAVAAYFCFGEHLTIVQMLGILVIIGGVYLVTQTQF